MSFRWFVFFLSFTLSMAPSPAAAKVATNPPYSCLFKKPFIFGASVSAGYGKVADALLDHTPGSQISPIAGISRGLFAKNAKITNVAEITNDSGFRAVGSDQFFYYFSDKHSRYSFSDFTLLASLDGAFWPGVRYSYSGVACTDVVADLFTMINVASRNQAPLILGTVPEEKAKHIDPRLRGMIRYYKYSCARYINLALKDKCKIKNKCFLIPIHKFVEQLRSPEGITFRGVKYKAINYDKIYASASNNRSARRVIEQIPRLRSDGLHLTRAGVQFAAGLIHRELLKAPDICKD